jgi:hypothetical protein
MCQDPRKRAFDIGNQLLASGEQALEAGLHEEAILFFKQAAEWYKLGTAKGNASK